jgi:hypothetical protein
MAPHSERSILGQKYRVSADAWLFPFLLKYTLGRRTVAPLGDAGATLRHLGPFDVKGIQLDIAITAGAGLRWRISVIGITPEIRFLHWTSRYNEPAQNEAMLMFGFTFPVQR